MGVTDENLGGNPYLYVDDLLIVAKGGGRMERFRGAMNSTMLYLEDMGAMISPGNRTFLPLTKKTGRC